MMGVERSTMDLTVRVHHEDDSYWAEVVDLPGCFASGDNLDELWEALKEAVAMCLNDSKGSIEVAELRVATSAPLQPA